MNARLPRFSAVSAAFLFAAGAAAQQATITLTPDASCYAPGDTVTVTVELSNVSGVDEIVGGQFRVGFDDTKLTYVNTTAAATVFTELISLQVNGSEIDLGVGVAPDPPGSGALSGTMAVMTFTAAQTICDQAALVFFRPDSGPNRTRLTAVLNGQMQSVQSGALLRSDLAAISADNLQPILQFGGLEEFDTDNASLWERVTHTGFACPDVIGTTTATATPVYSAADGSISATVPSVACNPQVGDETFFAVGTSRALDTGNLYDGTLLGDLSGKTLVLSVRFNTSKTDGTFLSPADFLDIYGSGTTYNPGLSVHFADSAGNTYLYQGNQPGVDNYLDATQMRDTAWYALQVDLADFSKWSDDTGSPVTESAFAAAVADVDAVSISGTGGDSLATDLAFTGSVTGTLDVDFVVTEDAEIVVPTDPGVCTADVALPAITVLDNCAATLAYEIAGTPIGDPHTFDPGATVVEAVATDDCGNVATWPFTVTVNDGDGPQITSCPQDQTLTVDANCELALPDFTADVVATDNCDPALEITQTPSAGTIVAPGTHTITLTVTDDSLNTATCDVVITAVDDAPPALTGPNATGGDAGSSCDYTVTFDASVSENCCLDPDDVVVDVRLAQANADLGTPTINVTGTNPYTIDGDVLVSNLSDCSATVNVTVFAADCYGNAVGTAGPALSPGRWTEAYNAASGPYGAGDSAIYAASWDGNTLGSEWVLNEVVRDGDPVLVDDTFTGDPNGNGEIVWRTSYSGGTLWLAAAVWGSDVTAEVVRHIHITHDVYVNGSLDLGQSYSVTTTHALVPDQSIGLTVSATATLDGNGVAPPADYPAPNPPYDQAAQWGTLTDHALTEIAAATATVQDVTAPVVTNCPGAINVAADAGTCDAVLTWTAPTVTDNCDGSPVVEYLIDLDDDTVVDATIANTEYTFPAGTHSVGVRAVDACGNEDTTCGFAVTVAPQNDLVVDLELDGALTGSFTRCVKFSLTDCAGNNVEFEDEVTFVDGLAAGVLLAADCGNYTCITAEDELHTLRVRLESGAGFAIAGTQYTAAFTGNDKLVQGDIYNDIPDLGQDIVDILDFGVYVTRWGFNYPPATCATAAPHADVNGDGVVDVSDFSFIQINFFTAGAQACCAQSPRDTLTPLTAISVTELIQRGLDELVPADLNADGMLDLDDIAAFLNGARPRPAPDPTGVRRPAPPAAGGKANTPGARP